MSKYLTDDGDEVEAFTEEEVNEKIEEAKKSIEENYANDIKEKEDAIAELNKKLEGKDDKEKNFANLREAKEALEKGIDDIKKQTEEEISKIKKDLFASELKREILSTAGGNKELAEKIELHYKSFQLPKEGEDDKRLENAILLATGGKISTIKAGSFSSGIGSAGSTIIRGADKLSEEAVELGKKFGLTEEELTGKKDKK
jgi:exonuclease VII large subunit